MKNSYSVLVAEDDHRLIEFIAKSFAKEGFHVEKALTTDEAFEKIEAKDYDVASLDFNFQGEDKNGLDIAKAIRKKSPKTAIIMLSGQLENSTLAEGFVDLYLSKPCDRKYLIDSAYKLIQVIPPPIT
jgi:two-component system, OmpR family, response regulator